MLRTEQVESFFRRSPDRARELAASILESEEDVTFEEFVISARMIETVLPNLPQKMRPEAQRILSRANWFVRELERKAGL